MASTLYRTGLNRIFYQTKNFVAGVTVTGYMWTPELKQTPEFGFTELGDGVYYLDHTFEMSGTHLGVFFEDNVKKSTSVFRVMSTKGNFIFTGDYRV